MSIRPQPFLYALVQCTDTFIAQYESIGIRNLGLRLPRASTIVCDSETASSKGKPVLEKYIPLALDHCGR